MVFSFTGHLSGFLEIRDRLTKPRTVHEQNAAWPCLPQPQEQWCSSMLKIMQAIVPEQYGPASSASCALHLGRSFLVQPSLEACRDLLPKDEAPLQNFRVSQQLQITLQGFL